MKILLKGNRIFIWYRGYWINTHIMSMINGGGVKGYYRFLKGWLKCIFGKHSYHGVFRMKEMKLIRECAYCREKEIEKDTMV